GPHPLEVGVEEVQVDQEGGSVEGREGIGHGGISGGMVGSILQFRQNLGLPHSAKLGRIPPPSGDGSVRAARKGGGMARVRWILGITITVLVVGAPLTYYRYTLTTSKRLRVVEEGRFYRSGQMTVVGFTDALTQLKIRTVINVQNEFPDPDL